MRIKRCREIDRDLSLHLSLYRLQLFASPVIYVNADLNYTLSLVNRIEPLTKTTLTQIIKRL